MTRECYVRFWSGERGREAPACHNRARTLKHHRALALPSELSQIGVTPHRLGQRAPICDLFPLESHRLPTSQQTVEC
jgi:hypothetical protein